MAKIFLFGSHTINFVSPEIEGYIKTLYDQGHEFIVGDARGLESAIHMSLSRIGVTDRTTVYCMDKARSNKYEIKERVFRTAYDEETKTATIFDSDTNEVMLVIEEIDKPEDIAGNRQYIEFKDKKMVEECTIAICLWNGESKKEMHIMQLMSMRDKPCYTYRF